MRDGGFIWRVSVPTLLVPSASPLNVDGISKFSEQRGHLGCSDKTEFICILVFAAVAFLLLSSKLCRQTSGIA